jgi:hypothetical protein
MRMLAANGTEIDYYGQRIVKFRGIEDERPKEAPIFQRRA